MARTAGGVDHLQLLVAELADARLERPVEDIGLDKLGRLQQGIALARLLGEVLVEVAQPAGAPIGVDEIVKQCARLRHQLAEEADQLHRAITRKRQPEQRVVRRIEQAGEAR